MNNVTTNPATTAIYKALDNANIQSTIVVVSMLNHDVNAIAVNRFLMSRKGYAFVAV
jgi:putative ribosome biogenesis GTPase RsgA